MSENRGCGVPQTPANQKSRRIREVIELVILQERERTPRLDAVQRLIIYPRPRHSDTIDYRPYPRRRLWKSKPSVTPTTSSHSSPFTVRTAAGDTHEVTHPEAMMQSEGGKSIVIERGLEGFRHARRRPISRPWSTARTSQACQRGGLVTPAQGKGRLTTLCSGSRSDGARRRRMGTGSRPRHGPSIPGKRDAGRGACPHSPGYTEREPL